MEKRAVGHISKPVHDLGEELTMELPMHIAAAAYTGNLLWYAALKSRYLLPCKRISGTVLVMAAFLTGGASHLLLDLVPHYAFLYKVWSLPSCPYLVRGIWALAKVAVVALPVGIILFRFTTTRFHWVVLFASIMGGIYPDVEKEAFLYLSLPRFLVLFPWHSLAYSREGGEMHYTLFLWVAQSGAYGVLLWGLYRLSKAIFNNYPGVK